MKVRNSTSMGTKRKKIRTKIEKKEKKRKVISSSIGTESRYGMKIHLCEIEDEATLGFLSIIPENLGRFSHPIS